MKISSSQQNLTSSHQALEQRTITERLRTWSDTRPTRPDGDATSGRNNASALASISEKGRRLAQAAAEQAPASVEAPESSAISDAMKGVDDDPGLALLRNMLERVFGIHIKSFDPSELNAESTRVESTQQSERAAISQGRGGWGVQYQYQEQRTEIETTRFSAEGIVKTEDGQTFEFKLSLEMTRVFSQQIDIGYRAGAARPQKDPLIFNFAGNSAQLANQRFEIDLDDDGKSETASFASPGYGFLVFDQNADGKINSGKEMFGPSTGDGFAELAAHDSDQNGWIDENDPIYAKLKVWTKTADGSDVLTSLKDAKVGAIALARLATPFAIRDENNSSLGQVRSSGVYLSDDGKVGTVQQVDLTV